MRVGRPSRRWAHSPSAASVAVAVAIAVLALAAVVWAAVVIAGRDEDATPGDEGGDPSDPGVSHVHGLGINPADDSLVVATHYGSFRISAGGDDAERIGDSFQDTMGFTVAGPDRFLGSGHPDVAGMQAGQPGRLGLIESTDAGKTWTILSLGDAADFHALAFAHGQVYGWDAGSGRFMVSADRNEWETRSTLGLFGFAVDPADADHIVAATAEGLSESRDGGRTWTPADGPALVTLSWHAAAGLWGAEPGGAVWRRDEAGWERAGTLPGEPQAFLAAADSLVAAVHDADGVTGIYRSTDDASTWDLRYRDEQQ